MNNFDSRAFGENLGAWVGRVTQQIREIESRLEQYRAVAIEMNDEIRILTTSLATLKVTVENLTVQVQILGNRIEQIDARNDKAIASGVTLDNQLEKIKALESNQNKVVWAIIGVFLTGVAGMVLNFSRMEYQLQHPSVPRSESPAKPSSKL